MQLGRWLCKTIGKPGDGAEKMGKKEGSLKFAYLAPNNVQEGRCAGELSGCSTFVATRQARLRLCCGWRGCGGGQSKKEWES